MSRTPELRGEARRQSFEIERWFLGQGLPFVIRDRRRHAAIPRLLPLLLFLTVLQAVDEILTVSLPTEDDLTALIALGATVLAASAVTAVFLWLRRDRRARLLTRTAGLIGAAAFVVVPPLLTWVILRDGREAAITLAENAGGLLVLYLLVLSGMGSLVGWAGKRAVLHFGQMLSVSTRAIPLLVLLVAFLFINTENWQMSAGLTRGRLWGVAGFFIVCILMFFLLRLPKELRGLSIRFEEDRIRAACANTPLAGWAPRLIDDNDPASRHPMRRRERWNVVALMLVSQCLQVLLLGLAVFVFFLLFGKIAITEAVMQQWVGRELSQGTVLWRTVEIPFPNELIQVCIVMSAVSSLYFAVYAVTDPGYRAEFFDDMLEELEDKLLTRECYLTVRDQFLTERGDIHTSPG